MRSAPIRTCIGCRLRAPKGDLVRIVRSREGRVTADPAQTAPGRGAYVHLDDGCVEAAGRRFARALRTGLGEWELGKLRNELKELRGAT